MLFYTLFVCLFAVVDLRRHYRYSTITCSNLRLNRENNIFIAKTLNINFKDMYYWDGLENTV